ncbi:MAG: cyclic nucleotide-binding domain-containing protein [Alphaproteobacteria bacterium]|nr:cyclic nucleotide-binding domain-containing protein [Alphaproteobacteria bacterium]
MENHHVFREGELGDQAFIVKSGTVQIYKTVEDKRVVLGEFGAGGMFGEMALIDDTPRMASARTINGGAVLMVISKKMFAKKMANMDPFARGSLKARPVQEPTGKTAG